MNSWIERLKTVFAWLGPVVFIIGLYFHLQDDKEYAAYGRYTVGYVLRTDYVISPDPHDVVFYSYIVNDSTYRKSTAERVTDEDQRYVVKFSAKNPGLSRFYVQAPIPDSVVASPPGGWATPPFPVPDYVREK